jgi:nucleoside-diphosphate-sugar epimerase
VIPFFARQIVTGASVVLHGSPPGSQTRDFVYVDDVVEALVRAGSAAGLSGTTLNVGSGVETSVSHLVSELEECAGRTARVVTSEQSGGVGRMCADISAARRELDWEPKHDLRSGLESVVNHITAGA